MRVADAPRQFYAIEILEHLDCDVAPEAAGVAELGCGDRAAHLGGERLQPLERRRHEEAVLGHAHNHSMAREARERRFELRRVHAERRRELAQARRSRYAEEWLDAPPQRGI